LYQDYGHFTDYFVSGGQDGVATIFGLGLTQGQTWKMQIQDLASFVNVTEVMDGVTRVTPVFQQKFRQIKTISGVRLFDC